MAGTEDTVEVGVMILRHRDGPHIVEVMVGDESLAEAAVLGSGTILAAFAARAALCRRSVAARHSRSTNCLLADRENPNSEEFVMFGPLSVLGSVSECGICIVTDLYLLGTVHTESLSVIGRRHPDLKSSDAPLIKHSCFYRRV